MTLLAPLALWLSALIAVPLLVHLLRRRIGARVEFPAARYLARAEKEHSRRLRLRNLLLMLVRVALVLVLAFAAAGPVASLRLGAGASTSHAPTAVAIVLDNSLSSSLVVSGEPVLDKLKAAVRSTLATVNASDRVWLVTVDGDVASGDRASVEDALARVVPFAGRARLDAAAARAVTLLESSSIPERVLLVVSDAQASTWTPLNVSGVRTAVFAPELPAVVNRSVLSAVAEPARWTPRGAVNARMAGADSATYRVSLDGRTLARGTAESDAAIVVSAAPAERGWLAGSVEIEPDEMRADDVRHFGVWIGRPPAVALDPAAGPFIASAVAVLKEASRATDGSGVAIVAAEHVRSKPALILAPSQPVQLGAANRALERSGVPWRFASAVTGRASVVGEGLNGVDVSARYKLERLPGATGDTLARVGTDPWIVAGDGYVLMGSTIDPSSTTLPIRASFVPWLAEVLTQRLGAEPGEITSALAGERLQAPRGATSLVGTDNSRLPVSGAEFLAPRRVGGYRWMDADKTIGILAVNPDSTESQLDRLTSRDLTARVRGSDAVVVADVTRLAAALFASSSRRELAGPLLIFALLLVCCEAALARERAATTTGRVSPAAEARA